MTVIPARQAPDRARLLALVLYGSLLAQLAEFAAYSAAHLPGRLRGTRALNLSSGPGPAG